MSQRGQPHEENRRWLVVPFVKVACPRCGRKDRETYGVQGRVRWHRCADCDLRFKSIEYPPSQVQQ